MTPNRAPLSKDHFDCPIWPECGCPTGTLRRDCFELQPRTRTRFVPGWWVPACVALGMVVWYFVIKALLALIQIGAPIQ